MGGPPEPDRAHRPAGGVARLAVSFTLSLLALAGSMIMAALGLSPLARAMPLAALGLAAGALALQLTHDLRAERKRPADTLSRRELAAVAMPVAFGGCTLALGPGAAVALLLAACLRLVGQTSRMRALAFGVAAFVLVDQGLPLLGVVVPAGTVSALIAAHL